MKQKLWVGYNFRIYHIALLLLLVATILSCNDENSCDNCNPPEEPINFRLTDFEPAWSKDGQWIAFYHGDTANSGIYLISLSGDSIIEWHDGSSGAPTWCPDNKWIAFSEGSQIWKKKIDGDSLTQLTFDGRNFFPSWSPDGKWIVFDRWIPDVTKFYGIYKMDHNGNETKILIYDEHEGDIRMPSWMNDSMITYCRYSPQFNSTEIFLNDTTGDNEIRLTFNNATDYYPKSSRDRIAFTSELGLKISIWVMDVDGSNLMELTDSQSYRCDWSPDGKYIVYTDVRSENGRLWIMEEDGSNKGQLTFEHHFQNF